MILRGKITSCMLFVVPFSIWIYSNTLFSSNVASNTSFFQVNLVPTTTISIKLFYTFVWCSCVNRTVYGTFIRLEYAKKKKNKKDANKLVFADILTSRTCVETHRHFFHVREEAIHALTALLPWKLNALMYTTRSRHIWCDGCHKCSIRVFLFPRIANSVQTKFNLVGPTTHANKHTQHTGWCLIINSWKKLKHSCTQNRFENKIRQLMKEHQPTRLRRRRWNK